MKVFDYPVFLNLINEQKWDEATQYVKFTIEEVNDARIGDFETMLDCVKYVYLDQAPFLTELFRSLRNFISIRSNQGSLFFCHLTYLKETKLILQTLIEQDISDELLKVVLQFIVNMVVQNKNNSVLVHQFLYNDAVDCLKKRKAIRECSALLYNIHLLNKDKPFTTTLVVEVLETKEDSEFNEFLIELFIFDENFWHHYKSLNSKCRANALKVVRDLWLEKNPTNFPQKMFIILRESFENSIEIIFQTASNSSTSSELLEVSLLLEVLASLSGNESYLPLLQHSELLIRSAVVLINIHRIGKQSDNYFSTLQKLSEIKEPSESIQQHPAFGFKVSLVRLIGNLCWRSKKMQDLAREADIIPVILDCCNIDARNPLIIQWAILAIRNLSENNEENQRIIAGLHKEGVVSSSLLEEMGITLRDDNGGEIRIVPLDLKK